MQEDTNGDGIVNHLDDNWHNIKVWRDLNQDGQTDEGELFTLEELGISGFDINAIQAARSTNGSIISAVGTYYKTDGTTGQIGNLLFASDPLQSEFTDEVEIPDEIRALAPVGCPGSGQVRDILQAASLDADFKGIFLTYSQASTWAEQNALISDLVLAWGNTSSMPTMQEFYQDQYEIQYSYNGSSLNSADIQQYLNMLHVMDVFAGRYSLSFPADFNSQKVQITNRADQLDLVTITLTDADFSTIESFFDEFKSNVYGQMVVQTRLRSSLAFAAYVDGNEIKYDLNAINSYFMDAIQGDTKNVLGDLVDYCRFVS